MRRGLATLKFLPLLMLSFTMLGEPATPSGGATAFVADNTITAASAVGFAPTGLAIPSGFNFDPHQLWAPPGLSVQLIAAGLKAPRFMAFDAAGNLLLADMGSGNVYRYPASNGSIDPSPGPPLPLISGLNAPSNMALWDGFLYVGETTAVARYAYEPASGRIGPREVVVPDLPRDGHSTRTVEFSPDGAMYVSVGSSCNICDESDQRRAAILRFAPDGSGSERFAWGLRNAVGLAVQPSTGLLWATVNERDIQGNEIPPDLVTIVQEGQNFGWPDCLPPMAIPQSPGRDCLDITPPTIGIQAHSAPLGLAFYPSVGMFAAEYANDLFVIQHGSWNREPPAAPKLLRIDFDANSQPVSASDFLTGWQDGTGTRWGRPAGVSVAPDGSLIISDDQAGVLYRVSAS